MNDRLPTVRSALAARCKVAAICDACDHDRELDLNDLIARGHGDTALLALPLRCACGAAQFRMVVSGSPPGYT